MQRFLPYDGYAELSDGYDVITFRQDDDRLAIGRKESVLGGERQSDFLVEFNRVIELGEWFTGLEPETGYIAEALGELPESRFDVHNEPSKRLGLISVASSTTAETDLERLMDDIDTSDELPTDLEQLVEESTALVETVRGMLGIVGDIAIDGAITESIKGTELEIVDGFRPALFASHTGIGLNMQPSRYTRLPIVRINELGQWIIDSRTELKKKNVWGL